MGEKTDDLRAIRGMAGQSKTVITTVSIASAFIAFASTFLFTTKSEMSDQRLKIEELRHKIEVLEIKLQRNKDENQKDLKALDENLRRFMWKRGVKPIPKEEDQ